MIIEAVAEYQAAPDSDSLYSSSWARSNNSAKEDILSMNSPTPTMTDRTRQGREPHPSLRGEDETEISYLTNLIESKSPVAVLATSSVADIILSTGMDPVPIQTPNLCYWSRPRVASRCRNFRRAPKVLRFTLQYG
jgi:hypothetical protein